MRSNGQMQMSALFRYISGPHIDICVPGRTIPLYAPPLRLPRVSSHRGGGVHARELGLVAPPAVVRHPRLEEQEAPAARCSAEWGHAPRGRRLPIPSGG